MSVAISIAWFLALTTSLFSAFAFPTMHPPTAAVTVTTSSSSTRTYKCTSARSSQGIPLFAQQTATFGMGCFWEPSEELLKVDGVVDTVAGYTGSPSATKAPTYDNVCFGREWVEGVQVTYDDSKISYLELMDAFFETQNPKYGSRQYSSIIFHATQSEQRVAEKWLLNNDASNNNNNNKNGDNGQNVGGGIRNVRFRKDGVSTAMTELEPKSPFYKAEEYHQRYWQKMRPRVAVLIGLLAVASGALNPIVPEQFQQTMITSANVATILGGVGVLLERKVFAKVEELPS